MRAVLFIVCLCSLVFQGAAGIYAIPHKVDTRYAYAGRDLQGKELSGYKSDGDCRLLADHYADARATDLIDDDLEDDECEALAVPQCGLYIAPHAAYVHPSYVSLLKHRSNCFRTLSPPAALIADKYIVQGVLRI